MKRIFSNPTLIALTIVLAFASVAHAQATRTWVSGVGDDANPCSRTAPCKTFAGAISKTAAGGEINALDSGGFGAVTITKAITIDGGPGNVAGVLAAGTTGINVSAAVLDTVTLRNLDINGATSGLIGISINSAKSVHIENCQIYGFRSGSGIGIRDVRSLSSTPPPQLFINDVVVRDNISGIAITGTSPSAIRAYLRNIKIQNNAGTALLGTNTAIITLYNSIISGNLGDGLKVDTNAFAASVSNMINNNVGGGAIASNGAGIYLADTSIFTNGTGVSGSMVSFGNNNVRNNTAGNTVPVAVGQQ